MESLKKPDAAGAKKLGIARRREVDVAGEGLVRVSQLDPANPLPLLVQPSVAGVDLIAWVADHRSLLTARLREHGGLLFRGFALGSIADFERLIAALSGDLLHYTYRSTPRSEVEGRIYTSTEYPPHQAIPMHNEMSYSRSWPMKIWFYCATRAPVGGETPIADSRRVWAALDPELRRRFVDRGVMYLRSYGDGLDLPWQNVFNTGDRGEVEAFCRAAGIDFEWRGEDGLRTRQICQAAARHPLTGDLVWFNQAHLFHVSSLEPELRRSLVEDLSEEGLPRNVRFGNDTPIVDAELDQVRRAYDEAAVVFPWQEGDLLLLDNMLVAHGRRPFTGERRILVGMAEEGSGFGIGPGDVA
jgi:alpha-ketoglutarate-dependent taurine dioxygenase